jgi:hypothetical protein
MSTRQPDESANGRGLHRRPSRFLYNALAPAFSGEKFQKRCWPRCAKGLDPDGQHTDRLFKRALA